MPVFFSRPQVGPVPPVALVSEIDREKPVKMRESFLSQKIQRQRNARGSADPLGPLPQLANVVVRIRIRRRVEYFAWEPQHTLGLVLNH